MIDPLRAVLFDAGDTLIRLRAASGALLVEAAGGLGTSIEPEQAAEVWRRVLARASTPEELAKGRDLSRERHREVWCALYADAGADRLAPGLAEALYQLTVVPESWEPFPDVEPTLRALRERGVPVGVLSDTGFDLRPVFAAMGLSDLLPVVVMSFEHGVCKPDPDVFRAACAALGADPTETLMVGDGIATDAGAVAAGLTVLLLPPPAPSGPRGLWRVLGLVEPRAG